GPALPSLSPIPPFAATQAAGFHAPTIAGFFPPPVLSEGTVFGLNRSILCRSLATRFLVPLCWTAASRARLVPNRGQNVAEMALDFVRVNIAEDIIGKDTARRFVPLLTTIFFAVLAANITGVVPGLNIASSSLIGFPLVMAVISFVAFIVVGVKAHGAVGYLRTTLF
ncbi:F0F1 ATP synthase subunit A, partial [Shewanella sp. Sh95]|uniref:F0F1 ATP synthase subunit A n=1 Tax=Shewanella sp. Sh95 TaxID=1689868 RepID=UPI0018D13B92